jgi:enoyl-CoA hydratase/carnithine racemase
MVHKTAIDFIDIYKFDTPKGNLLSLEDIELILSYIESAENDNNVKGVILTGKSSSFSTGLDNSSVIENYSNEKSDYFFKTFDLLLLHLFIFPKPVVAAVNGHSIGGGLLMQCCADQVFVADDAKIKMGFPELKMGLTIDELMKCVLNYCVDNNKIISTLLYRSTYFGHQKSVEYGFVDEIVSPENLMDSCLSYIQTLTKYNSKAFAITKQIVKADCKEKMQLAFNKNCYRVLTELLAEKYPKQ